jgi:signal transduction histidine kinase/DNA-binding response OmpR family regulator
MAIAVSNHKTPLIDLSLPAMFILLTGLTSWLSSRRLFTALAWALSMAREARKNADEARGNRAEVRRVLKSLDEAYVRLERTNEALIFAREAAEKAYRFKAEFVTNVSHELRTPLNLIVGFSEMMATAPESYGGVPLPREYRGDVMAIYRSARHLSDLINDVLDLSRIESGRLPLSKEPADLGEVVREATEIVRGLAEARGLRLKLDLPDALPMLRLDRTRVRQVLLNLLTNATRFTDAGWIRTRVRMEGGEAIITVEDTGRGIPPDRLNRAFEAFTQLDEDRAREGSGLGLAVSKKFVELHGGRMWIESEVGRGTAVGFSLPIPREGQEVQVSPLKVSPWLRSLQGQPTVLVLHDDLHAMSLLRRYIDGFQFVLADTADKVHKVMQETWPVAVIADATWAGRCDAPDQALELPAHIPVITCSLPSIRRQGLLPGATDYLPKPITRQELWDALSRLPRPPRTVLIVDDDPHVVRLLARMLKAGDPSLRVLEAFGGQEGLEIARSQRPDVILLDLVMPEVNGYAFLEEITHDSEMAGTPIIIVSVRGIEQETKPIMGELRLERETGFSISEALQVLSTTLSAITQPAVILPASAVTLLEAQAG